MLGLIASKVTSVALYSVQVHGCTRVDARDLILMDRQKLRYGPLHWMMVERVCVCSGGMYASDSDGWEQCGGGDREPGSKYMVVRVIGDAQAIGKDEAEEENDDDEDEEDADGPDCPEGHALEARTTACSPTFAPACDQMRGVARQQMWAGETSVAVWIGRINVL